MLPSRILTNRILVRALTSARQRTTTQALTRNTVTTFGARSAIVIDGQYRFKSTQVIEEDSSAEIDNLLEDAVEGSSASYSNDASSPIPEKLLEKVSFNCHRLSFSGCKSISHI